MTSSLLLDLETYAIDGIEAYVEKPSAPSNYKNEETIARYVEEAFAKVIAKAALKPDLGRIVALAWQQDDRDTEPRVITCKNESEERYALQMFFEDFADGNKRILTFGGHRMDLPFLMRRAHALGVPYPYLRVDRNSPHLDLYRVLSFDDAIDGYKQSFYIKRYGLDVDKCIDDDVTGADIAALVKADNWDAVAHHCKCDVMRLYLIADWLDAINAREPDTDKPFSIEATMARARLLSKSLSTSEKFAALREFFDDDDALGLFAQLLYTMLQPHVDDHGRFSGDATIVKRDVLPSAPEEPRVFMFALEAMHVVGLIDRYDAGGQLVIEVTQFDQHQRLKWHAPSGYPANPARSGNVSTQRQARREGVDTICSDLDLLDRPDLTDRKDLCVLFNPSRLGPRKLGLWKTPRPERQKIQRQAVRENPKTGSCSSCTPSAIA